MSKMETEWKSHISNGVSYMLNIFSIATHDATTQYTWDMARLVRKSPTLSNFFSYLTQHASYYSFSSRRLVSLLKEVDC